MTALTWPVTILSLVGVVLNIKRSRWGFAVWTITNSFWMIYDFQIGAYAQSALFAVYLGFALWGLWEWRE